MLGLPATSAKHQARTLNPKPQGKGKGCGLLRGPAFPSTPSSQNPETLNQTMNPETLNPKPPNPETHKPLKPRNPKPLTPEHQTRRNPSLESRPGAVGHPKSSTPATQSLIKTHP